MDISDPAALAQHVSDNLNAWITATLALLAAIAVAVRRVRAGLREFWRVLREGDLKASVAVLLAAGLALSACAQLAPVYDRSLGPADTAPQRVYRLAGALDVVGKRLASEPQGAAVRANWQRAAASFRSAYAAVTADNAPPELPSLIGRGALDLYALAAAAGLTEAMRLGTAVANPAALGMLPAELAVEAATAIPTYAVELPRLRAELQAMVAAGVDPEQAQWDARLAAIAASGARILGGR